MKDCKKEVRKIRKEYTRDRWDRPYHKERGRKGKSYLIPEYDVMFINADDDIILSSFDGLHYVV